MSLDARLTRVLPALSARERYLLELRAYKTGTAPDLEVRHSMPPSQRTEFNRYVTLHRAVNVTLGHYISLLAAELEKISLRVVWVATMAELIGHLWKLAEMVPDSKRARADALLTGSRHMVDLPWQQEGDNTWLDLCESAAASLEQALTGSWRELLALERVLDESSAEVGGEDILHPRLRQTLAECVSLVTDLCKVLNVTRPELADDCHELVSVYSLLECGKNVFA